MRTSGPFLSFPFLSFPFLSFPFLSLHAATFIRICRAGQGRVLQLSDTAVRQLLLWCSVRALVPFSCG